MNQTALKVPIEVTSQPAKSAFNKHDLIECGKGKLFGEGNARLPLPPLLMFDRITCISTEGGLFGNGYITAELDVQPSDWFFLCHFQNDPVMPGSLGLEALWQLTGFFLAYKGYPGIGRVINSGQARFKRQITPCRKTVIFRVEIKKIVDRNCVVAQSEGTVSADGEVSFISKGIRIGLI